MVAPVPFHPWRPRSGPRPSSAFPPTFARLVPRFGSRSFEKARRRRRTRRARSAASSARSSSRWSSTATDARWSRSSRGTVAPTPTRSPARPAPASPASRATRRCATRPASSPARCARSHCRACRRCSSSAHFCRSRCCGSAPARNATWPRCRRPSCSASRAGVRWTSSSRRLTIRPERRSPVRETEKIWMNGELVDWADARIHVGAHGLHYGSGVFEGIRAYETAKGTAVFRLTDHLQRLHNSARLLHMELPYSLEELRAASHELIAANGLPECYLRPIAFFGYGELGVSAMGNPVDVVIMSWPWGAYLGEEGLKNGITAKISSWERIGPNVIPHVAKATGVYLNSMLAVTEANRAGYDEAILLTAEGYVADGSGENIFVVRDGKITTPPISMSILPGITRETVIDIAGDLGYVVEERNLIRSDLMVADEVFMCGTAAEVTPVRSVDDVEIGVGAVTLELQKAYLDAVRGRSERYEHWLEYALPARAQA